MGTITISRPNQADEIREMTAEEEAQRQADISTSEAEATAKANHDALKASAKAKLIAGEALTEDEADTIVL